VRITFFVSGPKFTIFSSNVGVVVVDQVHFRFSLRRTIPEIFKIKFESCEKSRRILMCARYHPGIEPHHLVKSGKVSYGYSHYPDF